MTRCHGNVLATSAIVQLDDVVVDVVVVVDVDELDWVSRVAHVTTMT